METKAGLHHEDVGPNLVDQLPAADELPGRFGQRGQDVERPAAEPDDVIPSLEQALGGKELKRSERDRASRRQSRFARHSVGPRRLAGAGWSQTQYAEGRANAPGAAEAKPPPLGPTEPERTEKSVAWFAVERRGHIPLFQPCHETLLTHSGGWFKSRPRQRSRAGP